MNSPRVSRLRGGERVSIEPPSISFSPSVVTGVGGAPLRFTGRKDFEGFGTGVPSEGWAIEEEGSVMKTPLLHEVKIESGMTWRVAVIMLPMCDSDQ